ncbi:MAG TPA: TlpA disulfide reductase family protein [Solirubrobacteraceae bacterium]|nr:TlpA disulfide reductase family protein [Solirubrobacteraceae bacterium]
MNQPGPLDFHDDDDARRAAKARLEGHGEPPPPPPKRRPFGWIVGILFLGWIAYITINGQLTEGPGSQGILDNRPLPPVAAPLVLSDLNGDANVATRRGQGQAGKRPACEVRGRKILNTCQLAERGPVVLGFYFARSGGACRRQLDVMERVRRDFPAVRFAAFTVRGDRGELRELVRERGWRFPVGHDRDGLVANVYGVAGCPTTTLAYPGGIVMHSYVGKRLLTEARLRAEVARLVERSRRRGWKAPPKPKA